MAKPYDYSTFDFTTGKPYGAATEPEDEVDYNAFDFTSDDPVKATPEVTPSEPEEPGLGSKVLARTLGSLSQFLPSGGTTAVGIASDAVGNDPEDPLTTYAGDTFNTMMSGAASVATHAGFMIEKFGDTLNPYSGLHGLVADLVAGKDMDSPSETLGEAMKKTGQASAEYWLDKVSDDYKAKAGAQLGDEDFGATTLVSALAGSAPEMVLTMGAGAVAGKAVSLAAEVGLSRIAAEAVAGGARAQRIMKYMRYAPAVGGAVAGGAAEGFMAAGASGAAVEEQVLGMSHEALLQGSPRYRDVYTSAEGATEDERQKYARETIADEAGRATALKVGAITAAMGAPMGAGIGHLAGGAASKLGRKSALKWAEGTVMGQATAGFAGEFLQEALQEGAQQFLENSGIREYADSTQSRSEGVLTSMVVGGMVGGFVGGTLAPAAGKQARDAYKLERKADALKATPRDPSAPDDRVPSRNPLLEEKISELLQAVSSSDVPMTEFMQVQRWANQNGGRTAIEYRAALEQLVATKQAPENVKADTADAFHENGLLTQKAFEQDAGNFDFSAVATFRPTADQLPALAQKMADLGVNPYLMDDGSLVVPQPADNADALNTITDALVQASGASAEVTVNGKPNEIQPSSPANNEGAATQGATILPEGTQPAQGAADPVTPRDPLKATEIIDGRIAALTESAGRALPPEELAQLQQEQADLEALVREQDKMEGVLGTPDTRLTAQERQVADDRRVEIRTAIEAHRAAVSDGHQLTKLQSQLGKIDDDGALVALSEKLLPSAVPTNAAGHTVITADVGEAGLEQAGRTAAAHPESGIESTDNQLKAGNYPKGHAILKGNAPGEDIPVSIENVPGSIRRDVEGGKWSRKMGHYYGYIRGTKSSDGDQVDVYMGRQSHDPSLPLFVVHQMDPKTGAFDEPKVVMGYKSEGEAKAAYLSEYPRELHAGLFGGITRMDRAQFAKWLKDEVNDVPPHPISKQPMNELRAAPVVRDEGTGYLDPDARDPANPVPYLAEVLDKYDNGLDDGSFWTAQDVATEIATLVEDSNDDAPGVRELRAALEEFYDSLEEDFAEYGGRGDADGYEDNLIAAVQAVVDQHGPVRVRDNTPAFAAPATPRFKRWFGKSKVVNQNGDPLRVFHGTASDIEVFKERSWFAEHSALAATFLGGGRQSSTRARAGSNMIPAYLSIQNPLDLTKKGSGGNTTLDDLLRLAGMDEAAIAKAKAKAAAADQESLNNALRRAGFTDAQIEERVRRISSWGMKPEIDMLRPTWAWLDNPMVIDILREQGYDGIKTRELRTYNEKRAAGVATRSNKHDHSVVSVTWMVFNPNQVKSATGNDGNFSRTNPSIVREESDKRDAFDTFFSGSKVTRNGRPLVVYHGTTAPEFDTFTAGHGAHNDGIFFSDDESVARGIYGRGADQLNIEGFRALIDGMSDEQLAATMSEARKRLWWLPDWDELYDDGPLPKGMQGRDPSVELRDQLVGFIEATFDRGEGLNQRADYALEAFGLKDTRAPAPGSRVVDAYLSLKNPLEIDAEGGDFQFDQQAKWIAQARAGGHDGVIISNYVDGSYADFGDGDPDNSPQHTVYIAFQPNQIKSASRNNGDYDPANDSFVREDEIYAHQAPKSRPDDTPAARAIGRKAFRDYVAKHGGTVLGDALTEEFKFNRAAQLIGQKATTPGDIAALAAVYRNPLFEVMRYFFVDDQNTVVHEAAFTVRMVASASLWTADAKTMEEIAEKVRAEAEKHGATGVWMMHNHPSGNPEASTADRSVTSLMNRQLRDKGSLRLLGHVVLNHTRFTSLDPHGIVEGVLPYPTGDQHDFRAIPSTPHALLGKDASNPTAVAVVASHFMADLQSPGSVGVITALTNGTVVGLTSLPLDATYGVRGQHALREIGGRSGGSRNFLVADWENVPKEIMDGWRAAADRGLITDIISRRGSSAAMRGLISEGRNYTMGRIGSNYGTRVHEARQRGADPRTVFEVAPHPSAAIARAWNALPLADRITASRDALRAMVPLLQQAGIPVDALVDSVGGYGDDVNPSHALTLRKLSSHQDRLAAAALLGQALEQESVILLEPDADETVGAVTVDFMDGLTDADAQRVYTALRESVGEDIGGFSVAGNTMEILNFSEATTEDLTRRVTAALNDVDGNFEVYSEEVGATFLSESDYDSHLQGLPEARVRAAGAARQEHQKAIAAAVAKGRRARARAENQTLKLRNRHDQDNPDAQLDSGVLGSGAEEAREGRVGEPAAEWPTGHDAAGRAADDPAPAFHQREVQPEAVSLTGVNYSTTPNLKKLDAAFAGSGSAGAERRRFGMGQYGKKAAKGDTARRLYFYEQTGSDLPQREAAVTGQHAYRVQLDNIYDLEADPRGIIAAVADEYGPAAAQNMDLIEEVINDQGFDGYVAGIHAGMHARPIVVFGLSKAVPVAPARIPVAYSLAGKINAKDAPPRLWLLGGLYSAMYEALQTTAGVPKEATAAQWRGWLDGAQRRGQFRKSERAWTKVDDLLDTVERDAKERPEEWAVMMDSDGKFGRGQMATRATQAEANDYMQEAMRVMPDSTFHVERRATGKVSLEGLLRQIMDAYPAITPLPLRAQDIPPDKLHDLMSRYIIPRLEEFEFSADGSVETIDRWQVDGQYYHTQEAASLAAKAQMERDGTTDIRFAPEYSVEFTGHHLAAAEEANFDTQAEADTYIRETIALVRSQALEDERDYIRRSTDTVELVDWAIRNGLLPEVEAAGEPVYEDYTLAGGDNYTELLFRADGMRYRSSHFGNHGDSLLMHVRYKERQIDGDGKILFLEEMQSDAGQQFNQLVAKARKRLADAEAQHAQVVREAEAIGMDLETLRSVSGWTPAQSEPYGGLDVTFDLWNREISTFAAVQAARDRMDRMDRGTDAPAFSGDWQEVLFRKMLVDAVQGGYDALAWTTAEQQAERYPAALSRVVDTLEWVPSVSQATVQALKEMEPKLERRVMRQMRDTQILADPDTGMMTIVDTTNGGQKLEDLGISRRDWMIGARLPSEAQSYDVTAAEAAKMRKAVTEAKEKAQSLRFYDAEVWIVRGMGTTSMPMFEEADAQHELAQFTKQWQARSAELETMPGVLIGRLDGKERFNWEISDDYKTAQLVNGERRELKEIVGAAIAESIQADPAKEATFDSRMVVGGKGMQLQYDQMMPKAAEKLTKKLGGKVVRGDLAGIDPAAPGGNEVWRLDITDQMREALGMGLPAYSIATPPPGTELRAGLYAEFPAAQRNDAESIAAGNGPTYYAPAGQPRTALSRDPAVAIGNATGVDAFTVDHDTAEILTGAEWDALMALPEMARAARLHAAREAGNNALLSSERGQALITYEAAATPLPGAQPAATLADMRRGVDRQTEALAVVAKVVGRLRGRPRVNVVADESGVDSHVRQQIERDGLAGMVEGFMDPITGAVTIIANNIHLREGESYTDAVERVIAEEVLGHHGLRVAFGQPAMNRLFDEVWRDFRNDPAMREIVATYRDAYGDPRQSREAARKMADEFLAKRDPQDQPGFWSMLVAWARTNLRRMGFVRSWTDNDLRNLMERVFDGVRTGRIPDSPFPMTQPVYTVTPDGAAVTSIRDGRGQRTTTYDGDTRTIEAERFNATVQEGWEQDAPALELHAFVGDIKALATFAAEEGAKRIVARLGLVRESAARAAGLHPEIVEGAMVLHVPDGAPAASQPVFSLRARTKGSDEVEEILGRSIAPSRYDMTWSQRFQQTMRELTGYFGSGDTWTELRAGWIDSATAIEKLERGQFNGSLLDAADSAYKFISLTKNLPQLMAAVVKYGVPTYNKGVFERVPGRKGLSEIYAPLYKGGQNLSYLYEGYAVARRSSQLIKQNNPDGTNKEKLLSQTDIDKLLELELTYPQFRTVFDEFQAFNHQLLDLAVDRGAMSRETAEIWKANDYVPFFRVTEEEELVGGMTRKRGLAGQQVSSKRLTGSDQRIQPVIQNTLMNTAAILETVYKNEAMNRIVALGDGIVMDKLPMKMEAVKLSNADIARQLMKAGFFMGDDSHRSSEARRAGKLLRNNQIDFAIRAVEAMTPAQRDAWTTFFRPTKPVGNDVVSVMVAGKPVYYQVTDPLVYRAIADMTPTTFGGLISVMGGAKHLLTNMVTADPGFMIANYLRDLGSAWVTVSDANNPLANLGDNVYDILTEEGLSADIAMAGGMTGGYFDSSEDFSKSQHKLYGNATIVDTPRKTWEAYRKIGQLSEQINRMAIARAVLKRGGSMAEAAYQAQDVLNFTQSGDAVAAQMLMRTVPFLNARIQGLYRLYKGARGYDDRDPKKAMMAFFFKYLIMAGLSGALSWKNAGDPRYEKLPDDQKDTYWHFFAGDVHIAIPKPFEVGVLAATIPERFGRLVAGLDSGKTFVGSMSRAVGDTLAFNPVPQLLKPVVEQWANKSFFTGGPIVGMELDGLEPVAQYNPWTSETARGFATMMDQVIPDFAKGAPGAEALTSPVRVEHMVRAYLGTVGGYVLQLSDAAVRSSGLMPEAPEWGSVRDVPMLGRIAGRFWRGPSEMEGRSKYSEDVYTYLREADAAYRTVNAYITRGEIDKARRLTDDKRTVLEIRDTLHYVRKEAAELNTLQRQVMMSTTMTAADKREKLDTITQQKNALMERVAPFLAVASGLEPRDPEDADVTARD